jgi:pSer/pThr/pTyr-binding forkhead associated (FHA) protein
VDKLILKLQDKTLEEFAIAKSPITIGREQSNDIVLDSMMVSRYHAKIFQDSRGYCVEDLGSGNGVLVNDKKVTKGLLKNRDEILVGNHVLVFVHEEEPPAEAARQSINYFEKTFVLPKNRPELMALRAVKKPDSAPEHDGFAEHITLIARDGRQERIELTKHTTVAGKGHNADIKLRGLWVGKTAFIISKEPKRYVITHCGGWQRTRVNGEVVEGARELHDGDVITVNSTTMQFNVKK